MKQYYEYIRSLAHQLRIMGIPCGNPRYIYVNIQSEFANTTIPDSTVRNSLKVIYIIWYVQVLLEMKRESAMSIHDNAAGLPTKPLPSGEKRRGSKRSLLH